MKAQSIGHRTVVDTLLSKCLLPETETAPNFQRVKLEDWERYERVQYVGYACIVEIKVYIAYDAGITVFIACATGITVFITSVARMTGLIT